MARIDELFHYLKEHKGSDLHLAAGLEPRIRVHGLVASATRSHTNVPSALVSRRVSIRGWFAPGYNAPPPRGCGGIGRRARFRSVCP